MEEDFLALLRGSAGVLAYVPATSMSVGDLVQGRPDPRIVCQEVSGAEGYTHGGKDGLRSGRMQVDCYGRSYAEAKAIARAVEATAHTYRGGRFGGIFQQSARDDREGGANEADRPFRISLDFMTNWRTEA